MSDLERRVEFSPGFSKWEPDPEGNFRVGAMRIAFLVIGQKGAVQWVIGTGWLPGAAREHQFDMGWPSDWDRRHAMMPVALDLGAHYREPLYEGHSRHMDCPVLNGPCYYDGSTLNAESWVEPFIRGGTDWLWPKLEAYYHRVFDTQGETA